MSPPSGRSPSTSAVILRRSVGSAGVALRGILDTLIPESGAANDQRFVDVGYGQTGVTTGGGPPQAAFPLQRRRSTQTYHPGGNDLVGVIHGMSDLLLMLKAEPELAARQWLRRRLGRADLP